MHFNDTLINAQQFFSVAEICLCLKTHTHTHTHTQNSESISVCIFWLPPSFVLPLCPKPLIFPLTLFIQVFSQISCPVSPLQGDLMEKRQTWSQRGLGLNTSLGLLPGMSGWTKHSSLTCWFFQKYHSSLSNHHPLFGLSRYVLADPLSINYFWIFASFQCL